MSSRDLQSLRVTEIKDKLKELGLSTAGVKNELIARLLQADPSESWMENGTNGIVQGESDQESETPIQETSAIATNTTMSPETEKLRREKELIERELQVARREIEIMRRMQELNILQPVRAVAPTNAAYADRNINIHSIGEMLSNFDGSGGTFERWKRQLLWLKNEYSLSEQELKVIATRSIKGDALEWFHSKPEYLEMQVDELLSELRGMFHNEPEKADRRTQFEKRVWQRSETFKEYFHKKVILANKVPIDEEEMVENIIRGIPDPDLREQARMHGFPTKALLLKRFEAVQWRCRSTANIPANREERRQRSGGGVASGGNCEVRNSVIIKRCRSCGSKNHLETACPTKDKGPKCFECRGYGHMASACPTKRPALQSSCVVSKSADGKYYKEAFINGVKLVALLDTGSDMCLMPASKYIEIGAPTLERKEIKFRGVGTTDNHTLGEFNASVNIDNVTHSVLIRVIPDSLMRFDLLLGADFFKSVEVEIKGGEMSIKRIEKPRETSDVPDILQIDCEVNLIDELDIQNSKCRKVVTDMINSYNPIKTRDVQIEMTIVLKDEKPVYQRARRLSPSEREAVNTQITEWLRDGIIQPSLSEFASPIVLVKKKDGTNRLCVDYRQINKKIIKDRYPLPLIEDQIDLLQDAKVFTTIDLKNGFFHVAIEKNSRKYTSFIIPDGQYEFLRVPFGLCNSPAVFQRFVNAVFRELIANKVVLTYMDDLIIPSLDYDDGLEKLRIVLNTAAQFGLIINWKKCQFLQTQVDFLGHKIENGRVRPSERKTEAVVAFPRPKTVKQIQSFLGLTGYFRKFIPNYSVIARPLSNLLRSDVVFQFGEEEERAFERLKVALINKPVLKLYKASAETELHTDASKYGYGCILLQRDSDDGAMHPVFYASGKTTTAEEKYTSYELEVLAIIRALRKFRVYLLGIAFKIVTDCRAFTLTMNKKDLCVRVARWALMLEEFQYTIEHRPGKNMAHVDALSRQPLPVCLALEESEESLMTRLKKAQQNDSDIQRIFNLAGHKQVDDFMVKGGLLFKKINDDIRLVVPRAMQTQVIRKAHENGHFAVAKTETLLKRDYWFPCMRAKIEKVLRNCVNCILADRKGGKQEGLLNTIDKGEVPLCTYHIDHLGPIPSTRKSYRFIFVVIDSFSKFVWLYPTKSTDTAEVLRRLKGQAAVFGNPSRIISDRGTAFTSSAFQEYCSDEKIEHILITTGVPRSNGQVERVNRTLIPLLTKLSAPKPEEWYRHVELAQRYLNSAPNRSIGTTPFHVLFGTHMRLAEDPSIRQLIEDEWIKLFQENRDDVRRNAKTEISKIQAENRKNYNKKRKEARRYTVGDLVAIQRTQLRPGLKFAPKYLGPYVISKVLRNDRYVVEKIGEHDGPRQTSASADHLKAWLETKSDDSDASSEGDDP